MALSNKGWDKWVGIFLGGFLILVVVLAIAMFVVAAL